MSARFINYYHCKYDRYACLTKSRRVPVSGRVYKLLNNCDYGFVFTLDGAKFYFVACYREPNFGIRYGQLLKINPPLFFVQYQMKLMNPEIEEKVKYHLSHFNYEV